MAKTGKKTGFDNTNYAEVSPTAPGIPFHNPNGNPLTVSTVAFGGSPSAPAFGETVSSDINNMRDTLMEMPDGRDVSRKPKE